MSTSINSVKTHSDDDNLIIICDKEDFSWAEGILSEAELNYVQKAIKNGLTHLSLPQPKRLIVIEFAVKKKPAYVQREIARRAGGWCIKILRHHRIEEATLLNYADPQFTIPYAEGLILANYQFLKYFSDHSKLVSSFKTLNIENSSADSHEVDLLRALVEGVYEARDLVNEPLSFLTAEQFSQEILRLGKLAGFKVEVFDKAKIEELKMGGLLAVNRGSLTPPTFNVLEWKPENAHNKRPIVLVGKGVVYDTGGLSLKPTANAMDFMKCDMAGAAAVVGAMYTIAKTKLPLHLICLVPATDNRPGQDAYVPGDVIKMHSGSTVEVLNTDAEGRMILADALHYAKKFDPELVLDFATLTGASARSVGPFAAAMMGTAQATTKNKMLQSGFNTYERLVEFPLWEEYGDMIKSDIADIKNLGGAMSGGITAGKFLQHFTDYEWLHIDMAGPAYMHKEDGYKVKGGTGYGVRLLVDFFDNY